MVRKKKRISQGKLQRRHSMLLLLVTWLILALSFLRCMVVFRDFPALPAIPLRSCSGRRIFVYDLPAKFNTDLLKQCNHSWEANMCQNFENTGMGREFKMGEDWDFFHAEQGPWYKTWQFSLDVYFHSRIKKYPCLTKSEDEADLFYVPFYAGLDLRSRIFLDLPRDALYLELLDWLEKQKGWKKLNERNLNHFMVIGRIASQFKRSNQMLNDPRMKNVIKLTLEHNPDAYDPTEVAIPYPTSFHPNSQDQINLLRKRALQSDQRKSLACMAGKKRSRKLIRTQVIGQCENDNRCTFLICSNSSEILKQQRSNFLTGQTFRASCRIKQVYNLFQSCEFCLQPPGDSPTRRSFFDAMLAGCIPVIFDKESAWTQYRFHLPYPDGREYSVLVSMQDLEGEGLMNTLAAIPAEVKQKMRTQIVNLIPRILYSSSQHGYGKDAFDITLDAIFNLAHRPLL